MGRLRWFPAVALVSLGGLLVGGLLAGCGSSPSAPTAEQPQPPPARRDAILNVRVIGTVTGEPIVGATVTVGNDVLETDQNGAFSVTGQTGDTRPISIAGPGLIARESQLTVDERDVTIDVIQNRAPFDLTFFRELGRNALESETGFEPLRLVSASPRIHIRTVDEAGRAMDTPLLDLVEATIADVTAIWSAGRFPIQVIERGPGARHGQSGWITVLFPAEVGAGGCGTATIGSTTGRIELNYRNSACACDGHLVAPRTVRHELGHVYGYWHTAARGGVMSKTWTTRQCDGRPSARESEHAKYLYARSPGNLDLDTDPAGRLLRMPGELVIVD